MCRKPCLTGRPSAECVCEFISNIISLTWLPTCLQIDQQFRSMWADHGDAISDQYAGTGAMKSAFTRTGKRDVWGLLDDGAKSLTRYYLNNFQDGHKQDALDLVTGSFKAVSGAVPAYLEGCGALQKL